MKPDIGSESRFLPTAPAFDAPVRGFPSEYCYAVWHRKTRMVWLPDGEKFWWYIYSFLHNPRTWQTDIQTDTAWRHRLRLCIASRGNYYRALSPRNRQNHQRHLQLCVNHGGLHYWTYSQLEQRHRRHPGPDRRSPWTLHSHSKCSVQNTNLQCKSMFESS